MDLPSINYYILSRIKQDNADLIYRSYVTDCLKILAENKQSEEDLPRYKDCLDEYLGNKVKDTRTARQIIEDTARKHNLKIEEAE